MTRILLIDDDRALLTSLSSELERAGYEVVRVSDLDQVAAVRAEVTPDLVLLEVGLQRGAGWKLLTNLVEQGQRVIVLSRYGASEDQARGLQSGATDYVGKPYHAHELLARIAIRLQQPAPLTLSTVPIPDDTAPEPGSLSAPDESIPAPVVHPSAADESIGDLPLGQRLRVRRKRRNISLVQANLETKIQMYYIQALEEEKYALLPRAPATDEIVRRYATFLGEDGDQALAEYHRLHSYTDDGLHDLEGRPVRRTRRTPIWAVLLLAALLACGLTGGAIALIFPQEVQNLWVNARTFFVDPTAIPTAQPTVAPTQTPPPTATTEPTSQPTATLWPSPTRTPRPTATVTPIQSPTATP